jgi:lipopolysaccharide transport system permease protein
VKQITPFLLQIWMYASPIVYPLSLVPREFHTVYALNPMVGVVAGFRSVLLGREAPPWPELLIAFLASSALLVGGTLFFRETERTFADVA